MKYVVFHHDRCLCRNRWIIPGPPAAIKSPKSPSHSLSLPPSLSLTACDEHHPPPSILHP